jgi:hypothetical protein
VLIVEDSRITLFQISEETSKARDAMALPNVWTYIGNANPLFDKGPKAHGEEAMQEEMVGGLQNLRARNTKPTIIPTPVLQMVRCPNPTLEGKPSKRFKFRRSPSPPHCLNIKWMWLPQ